MQLCEIKDENLKYAIVELIAEKGAAESVECCLLRGISGDVDGNFLWAVTNKKTSRSYNLDYFNILSLATYDGITKKFYFFMADKDEQDQAKKLVEQAYECLKKKAAAEGTTLLDVSKFESVPDNFDKIDRGSKRIASPTHSQTGAPSVGGQDYYNKNRTAGFHTAADSKYDDYWNRDPEPFFWKRKTRKPTKKALEKMREAIQRIAKGEYEFEPKAIKGEKEEREKESTNKTQEAVGSHNNQMFAGYDDENFPFGCH
jgi:hypothetical protein